MPKALIPSLSLELCYNCYKVPQVVDILYDVSMIDCTKNTEAHL